MEDEVDGIYGTHKEVEEYVQNIVERPEGKKLLERC
jgi:hypothetical protein